MQSLELMRGSGAGTPCFSSRCLSFPTKTVGLRGFPVAQGMGHRVPTAGVWVELMEGSQTKQGLGQRGYGGVGVCVPVSATHKPPRAPLTPWSHPLPPNTLSVSPNRHSQGTYTVLGLATGTQLSPELPESHHTDKQQQSWLGGRGVGSDPTRQMKSWALERVSPSRACVPATWGCLGWDLGSQDDGLQQLKPVPGRRESGREGFLEEVVAELIQEGFPGALTPSAQKPEADVWEADIWTTGRSDASHRVDRPSGEGH